MTFPSVLFAIFQAEILNLLVSIYMNTDLVITFMGNDQPGLVESLASTIVEEEGNWLESRMCHLGGQFAGVLRVAVPSNCEMTLQDRLKKLEESGLSVAIRSEPNQAPFESKILVIMELMGNDRVGIVSRISGLLARLSVNVEDLKTELTTAPMSAELLFKVRAILMLPKDLELDNLRDELETVASDLMVDLQLHQAL